MLRRIVADAIPAIIGFRDGVVICAGFLVRDGAKIYVLSSKGCFSGNRSVFCAFRHRNHHFITWLRFTRFAIITCLQCKRKFAR